MISSRKILDEKIFIPLINPVYKTSKKNKQQENVEKYRRSG